MDSTGQRLEGIRVEFAPNEFAAFEDLLLASKTTQAVVFIRYRLTFDPNTLPCPPEITPKEKAEKERPVVKRAFEDEVIEMPKKRSTTTAKLLQAEKDREEVAEGTWKEYVTTVQKRWCCEDTSCYNCEGFCWRDGEDPYHYTLSSDDVSLWGRLCRKSVKGETLSKVTFERIPTALKVKLYERKEKEEEKRGRRESRTLAREQ